MDRSEVHQFLRINDFGGEPKTGPHYLTIAHTSSAAARLQLCKRIAQQIALAFGIDIEWQANLRILEVQEIRTVPYVPLSHPCVERLIGTIRREYL